VYVFFFVIEKCSVVPFTDPHFEKMSTLLSVCFILVTGFYQFIDGNPVQLKAKVPISVYADLSETNLEEYINGKIDEEIEKQL
jgi:hypothetical protein